MKSLSLIVISLFAAVASLMQRGRINVCNSAGTHPGGKVRRLAETAFTAPHLIAGKGTTAGLHVIPCGQTGTLPLGNALDEAAAGENVTVDMAFGETKLGVAASAIAADVPIYTAAGGKLQSTGGTGRYLMGRSVTAAGADNDEFEYVPYPPAIQA